MMLTAQQRIRRWLGGTVAVGLLAATMTVPAGSAQAQQSSAVNSVGPRIATVSSLSQQPLPTSVLLFPAVISAEGGAVAADSPTVRQTQEIVTDAVRKYLEKGGVGVVVYSSRLPSVERAVQEGGSIKEQEAVKGPGDDPRLAQKFAEIVGAQEYIMVNIDNYAYDPKTRRATFNLSLTRSSADGTSLASSAEKAVGEAPATTVGNLQEGSAVARAAEFVAQKSVIAVYPQTAVIFNPPPQQEKKKARGSKLAIIIPAAALGAFLLIPR
jgi:hypothetical protein